MRERKSKTSGYVFAPIFLLFFSACGSSGGNPGGSSSFSQTNSSGALVQALAVNQMNWNSVGTEDLAYTLTPVGNGASFSIQVTRYHGVGRNSIVRLNSDDSRVNYDFLLNLFRGQFQVTTGPQNGSNWSTVTFYANNGFGTSFTSPLVPGYTGSNPFTLLNQFIKTKI